MYMFYEGLFSYQSGSQCLVNVVQRQRFELMMDDCCFSCSDRARVVGGLPDVVAIQEGKVNNETDSDNTLFLRLLLFFDHIFPLNSDVSSFVRHASNAKHNSFSL